MAALTWNEVRYSLPAQPSSGGVRSAPLDPAPHRSPAAHFVAAIRRMAPGLPIVSSVQKASAVGVGMPNQRGGELCPPLNPDHLLPNG